jgi:hypothetical protein
VDCTPDPAVSGQDAALLDRPVRLRRATPAVLFLESLWPLSYIGSQVMVFFAPVVHALFSAREYDLIQQALEHREAKRINRRARRRHKPGTLP